MKKFTFIAAICAATLILTGCGSTPEEKAAREAQRAQQRADAVQSTIRSGDSEIDQGRPDKALKTFDRGIPQAQRDNPALVEAMYAGMDRAVRALVQQARNQASARRWSEMLRALDVAAKYAPKLKDQTLAAEVASLNGSKIAALARTSRAYAKMCREAGWSTWNHIFSDGNDWFTDWSEWSTTEYNIALIQAAAETGDSQLIEAAGDLASQWVKLQAWRKAQRARQQSGGSSGWDLLVDVGVAIGSIGSDIKFQNKQKAFESRLETLFNQNPFPGTPVASAPRQPVTPPAAPTAQPAATSFQGTGGGTTSAAVPPVAPPAATTVVTTPRTGTGTANAPVDRQTPNFEDLR